jgi:hypothetical protein
MPLSTWRRLVGSLLVVALVVGCSTDREQTLIGTWQGDPLSGTFAAAKMKEETPGATVAEARAAAAALANTAIEFRKDKTFQVAFQGQTFDGTWTFNKESGEVLLNILESSMPLAEDGAKKPKEPMFWVAQLDDQDYRLGLFMMPPESVALMKKSLDGKKQGLSNGISLYKQ